MSLILDALKKLDREKSSRRSRTGNIAVEILSPGRPRPGRRIGWTFVAVSFTAIVAAAITYGMIAGFGSPPKSSPPVPVNPPPPSQEGVAAPPSGEPVREARGEVRQGPPKIGSPAENKVENRAALSVESKSSRKSPAVSGPPSSAAPVAVKPPIQEAVPPPSPEPEREARSETSRVPPKIQSPAASGTESKEPASAPGGEKPSQKVIREEASVAPGDTKRTIEPPPKESTPPPSLKLSGILWHEEPSERRAMINGMILNEGAIIEGAKIVEILPTRVRLSHDGKPFEISINILDR